MAIYIEGATKCPLCDLPVDINDKANSIYFDPFIVNEFDALFIFSGAVCHKKHFEQHPQHDAVLQRIAERTKHIEEEACYISGTAITIDNYKNPANLIFTDKLVDDKQHPLYEYNYRYLNKYYLPTWSKLGEFVQLINELNQSGLWGGDYLSRLLTKVKSPVQPAWDPKMIAVYKARFEEQVVL